MKLADMCNFGALRESQFRDTLLHEIRDDTVLHKVLGKKDLSLAKCLEILRTSQVTSHAVRQEFRS